MCWSAGASIAMVGLGIVATGVTARRGEPKAIWLTLGYFTAMEALQVAGYAVVDQCGTPLNRSVTLLSYLHIVFQPILINAFAMELVPSPVKRQVRRWVYLVCSLSVATMLFQLMPLEWAGQCLTGLALCADLLCTRTGSWHIAWDIPYNGLLVPLEASLGTSFGFPSYVIAAFVLPLVYGAWRFVIFHILAGPVLASLLTTQPNEMPAVWCLFSICILIVGMSPAARGQLTAKTWWGRTVAVGLSR